MGVASAIGGMARQLDRRFGVLALLVGEPRPPAGGFDLKGEKLLDWGYICSSMPPGPKRALEIGCGESPIIPAMLARGYEITGIDLCADVSKRFAGIHFVLGDFMNTRLERGFEVVVACSAVEHIGLSGRYGSLEDPDGDLKAMARIRSLLAPDGLFFLTIPVGLDAVMKPWHRIYGRKRLPLLLEGFDIVDHRYWVKEPWGPWRKADPDTALEHPVDPRRYALGQMILSLPATRPA